MEAHFKLGDVYIEYGNPEKAVECFKEATRLSVASPRQLSSNNETTIEEESKK